MVSLFHWPMTISLYKDKFDKFICTQRCNISEVEMWHTYSVVTTLMTRECLHFAEIKGIHLLLFSIPAYDCVRYGIKMIQIMMHISTHSNASLWYMDEFKLYSTHLASLHLPELGMSSYAMTYLRYGGFISFLSVRSYYMISTLLHHDIWPYIPAMLLPDLFLSPFLVEVSVGDLHTISLRLCNIRDPYISCCSCFYREWEKWSTHIITFCLRVGL